jgi:hypothetical protein
MILVWDPHPSLEIFAYMYTTEGGTQKAYFQSVGIGRTGSHEATPYRTLQTTPAPEAIWDSTQQLPVNLGSVQRPNAWTHSADHDKSTALLAGANDPQDQALGHSGRPAENGQFCRTSQFENIDGEVLMVRYTLLQISHFDHLCLISNGIYWKNVTRYCLCRK